MDYVRSGDLSYLLSGDYIDREYDVIDRHVEHHKARTKAEALAANTQNTFTTARPSRPTKPGSKIRIAPPKGSHQAATISPRKQPQKVRKSSTVDQHHEVLNSFMLENTYLANRLEAMRRANKDTANGGSDSMADLVGRRSRPNGVSNSLDFSKNGKELSFISLSFFFWCLYIHIYIYTHSILG